MRQTILTKLDNKIISCVFNKFIYVLVCLNILPIELLGLGFICSYIYL